MLVGVGGGRRMKKKDKLTSTLVRACLLVALLVSMVAVVVSKPVMERDLELRGLRQLVLSGSGAMSLLPLRRRWGGRSCDESWVRLL